MHVWNIFLAVLLSEQGYTGQVEDVEMYTQALSRRVDAHGLDSV